jgi:hypothetical protein
MDRKWNSRNIEAAKATTTQAQAIVARGLVRVQTKTFE